MSIRNLLSAAAIAITIGAAAVAPAPAQASNVCYFESSRQALGQGRGYYCRAQTLRNANNHPVTQVTWEDGVVTRYVFWSNGRVEIFSAGQRYFGSWSNQTFNGIRSVMVIHDSQAITIIGEWTIYH